MGNIGSKLPNKVVYAFPAITFFVLQLIDSKVKRSSAAIWKVRLPNTSRPVKPQTFLKSNNIFINKLSFLSLANNNEDLCNISRYMKSNALLVIEKLLLKFFKLRILLDFQTYANSVVKTNMQINANIDNHKKVSTSFFSTNGINKKIISAATYNVEIPNTSSLIDNKPIAI